MQFVLYDRATKKVRIASDEAAVQPQPNTTYVQDKFLVNWQSTQSSDCHLRST